MTEQPKFVAGPNLQEPLPTEQPPKRRGRPPKVDPVTGERVNKSPTKRRGRPRKSLEPQIRAFLSLANTGVMMAQGKLPPPVDNGDALDTKEIELLSKALDAQCQISPRFRKYVEIFIGVGSGGQLIVVATMIGARRLARHNVIPQLIDDQLGTLLGSVENVVDTNTPEEPSESNDDANDDNASNAA